MQTSRLYWHRWHKFMFWVVIEQSDCHCSSLILLILPGVHKSRPIRGTTRKLCWSATSATWRTRESSRQIAADNWHTSSVIAKWHTCFLAYCHQADSTVSINTCWLWRFFMMKRSPGSDRFFCPQLLVSHLHFHFAYLLSIAIYYFQHPQRRRLPITVWLTDLCLGQGFVMQSGVLDNCFCAHL